MATAIQAQFKQNTAVRDRGVNSAGFWVLYKTTMPSVLIELGFISNSAEEAYLRSEKGQNQMAEAIYNAFKAYKKKHDTLEKQKLGLPKAQGIQVAEGVSFRVQFLSLAKEKTLTEKKYSQLKEIKTYQYKGLYRYTSGDTSNYNAAINHQSEVRKLGFKDAFIIAIYKGERVSIAEAKKLIK